MAKRKRLSKPRRKPAEDTTPDEMSRGFDDGLAGRKPEEFNREYCEGYTRGYAFYERRHMK